jgi:hypothetical protein
MDARTIQNLETHELMNLMLRTSSSGKLQLLRTTITPQAFHMVSQLYENALGPDPIEWMMHGLEMKAEIRLSKFGLLELFRKTQSFEGYHKARESVKQALNRLTLLKQAQRLFALTPGTPKFDEAYFFFDFTPGNYQETLVLHQGTVADAAGRGDLAFFKRLYNKVKNDQTKRAGGQYEHFLTTFWLHEFFWLMPDRLACREVARRMESLFAVAATEGLEGRKDKEKRKLTYATQTWHESQRKRFRQAVKSLELFQHPASPVTDTRTPTSDERSATRYVWKNGWPN